MSNVFKLIRAELRWFGLTLYKVFRWVLAVSIVLFVLLFVLRLFFGVHSIHPVDDYGRVSPYHSDDYFEVRESF